MPYRNPNAKTVPPTEPCWACGRSVEIAKAVRDSALNVRHPLCRPNPPMQVRISNAQIKCRFCPCVVPSFFTDRWGRDVDGFDALLNHVEITHAEEAARIEAAIEKKR